MSSLDRELKKRCKKILRERAIPRSIRLEIEDHFLCEIQQLMDSGLSMEESVAQASKSFGSIRAISDELSELDSGLAWYRKFAFGRWIYEKFSLARDSLTPRVAYVGTLLLIGLLASQICNLPFLLDRMFIACANIASFVQGN